MRKPTLIVTLASLLLLLGVGGIVAQSPAEKAEKKSAEMQLGNFSVSLAVKDIKASKAFYEKLGFHQVGGKLSQNWVILQNDTTSIGLFQGMFKKNVLTFNPGWDKNQKTLKQFTDVRELQSRVVKRGIKPVVKADLSSTGPASFMITDPDGNSILIDQHVPKSR